MRRPISAFVIVTGSVVAVAALLWWLNHRLTPIEAAMLTAARHGQFQPPIRGQSYTGGIECRVDRPHAFHGADVYLCAIDETGGWREWEWGAMLDGRLHTHATDPGAIPTITGPWDPPW
jgi:hypothetical protein